MGEQICVSQCFRALLLSQAGVNVKPLRRANCKGCQSSITSHYQVLQVRNNVVSSANGSAGSVEQNRGVCVGQGLGGVSYIITNQLEKQAVSVDTSAEQLASLRNVW